MTFFSTKNIHLNSSMFKVLCISLLGLTQVTLYAADYNDEQVVLAVRALKSVLDSHWDNPEVSTAQIERDVHQKFSFEVLEQLYSNKQPIYSAAAMYPIAYSFMIEAPRKRGTRVSEYLVAHVLKACYRAPKDTSQKLLHLAEQAVEDKVAPYLRYVITHEGLQENELVELQELVYASNDDRIKEIMAVS